MVAGVGDLWRSGLRHLLWRAPPDSAVFENLADDPLSPGINEADDLNLSTALAHFIGSS